jgi:HEAT repeat protein
VTRARIQVAGCLLLGAAALSGCRRDDLYARLQHEDPSVRAAAIAKAARWRDDKAVPYLIDRLSDSEADVRLFAGVALRRITGLDMGWRPYDPPAARARAERRWRAWLDNDRSAPPPPTTQEARRP